MLSFVAIDAAAERAADAARDFPMRTRVRITEDATSAASRHVGQQGAVTFDYGVSAATGNHHLLVALDECTEWVPRRGGVPGHEETRRWEVVVNVLHVERVNA